MQVPAHYYGFYGGKVPDFAGGRSPLRVAGRGRRIADPSLETS